jgi:antitoxin HicB
MKMIKKTTDLNTVDPSEILRRPYARVLTPEPEGQYTAEIMEFPGCVAYGDNAAEALKNLDEVSMEWVRASLEQGQDIPGPMANIDYSGRLVLRITKGLHQRSAMCAEREGVSLNQFIVTCLAEAVGERARPLATFQPYWNASAHFYFSAGHSFEVVNKVNVRHADIQLTTVLATKQNFIGLALANKAENAHARS